MAKAEMPERRSENAGNRGAATRGSPALRAAFLSMALDETSAKPKASPRGAFYLDLEKPHDGVDLGIPTRRATQLNYLCVNLHTSTPMYLSPRVPRACSEHAQRMRPWNGVAAGCAAANRAARR